ncbi:MAG: Cell division protein ZapA [Pseudomonadota bacterium]|jgi:cell division protein ZapA (FtsZ GTPase activity inhibitor)
MSEVVQIRLGDETFKLRTDRAEALHRAAGLVDEKLAELRAGGVPSTRAAALLAALSLADELLLARGARDALRDRTGSALESLTTRLDELDGCIEQLGAGR